MISKFMNWLDRQVRKDWFHALITIAAIAATLIGYFASGFEFLIPIGLGLGALSAFTICLLNFNPFYAGLIGATLAGLGFADGRSGAFPSLQANTALYLIAGFTFAYSIAGTIYKWYLREAMFRDLPRITWLSSIVAAIAIPWLYGTSWHSEATLLGYLGAMSLWSLYELHAAKKLKATGTQTFLIGLMLLLVILGYAMSVVALIAVFAVVAAYALAHHARYDSLKASAA